MYVLATSQEQAKDIVSTERFEEIIDKCIEIKSPEDVIVIGEELELVKINLCGAKEDEWQFPIKHFISPEFQLTEIIET